MCAIFLLQPSSSRLLVDKLSALGNKIISLNHLELKHPLIPGVQCQRILENPQITLSTRLPTGLHFREDSTHVKHSILKLIKFNPASRHKSTTGLPCVCV